jgi:hypothetical protein
MQQQVVITTTAVKWEKRVHAEHNGNAKLEADAAVAKLTKPKQTCRLQEGSK